ncbi:MAG: hypothetical protein WCJ56_02420 [bacterium]
MKDQAEPEAENSVDRPTDNRVMIALVIVVVMIAIDITFAMSMLSLGPYFSRQNADNNGWTTYEFFAYSALFLSLVSSAVLKIGVIISANRNVDQTMQRTNRVILTQLGLGGLWAVLGLISAYLRQNDLAAGPLGSLSVIVMWFSIGMYALYMGLLFAVRGLFRWK